MACMANSHQRTDPAISPGVDTQRRRRNKRGKEPPWAIVQIASVLADVARRSNPELETNRTSLSVSHITSRGKRRSGRNHGDELVMAAPPGIVELKVARVTQREHGTMVQGQGS